MRNPLPRESFSPRASKVSIATAEGLMRRTSRAACPARLRCQRSRRRVRGLGLSQNDFMRSYFFTSTLDRAQLDCNFQRARERRKSKAQVERSGTLGSNVLISPAREAGGRGPPKHLSPVSRAQDSSGIVTQGSAAHHPGLYAVACYRRLVERPLKPPSKSARKTLACAALET